MKGFISKPMLAAPSVDLLTLVIAEKLRQREQEKAREREYGSLRELRYEMPVPDGRDVGNSANNDATGYANDYAHSDADIDSFDPDE